jgi:tetratricopeptide (TPR) repeat protein
LGKSLSSDKSSIIDKAQKLAAKGQLTQAIAEWQRLIAETPNDGNIYNTIGDLHLKANHKDEATEAYLKAADAFKTAGFELKSIAVYKKIIKVDPSQMDVYEKLADVHAERGLTGNAVEDYLKVAKHYVKQDNFLSALSVYRKLANLDPQNSSVRLKIAEMCQKQGLGKEAVEEYEKVLEIYKTKNLISESHALIEQILKVDPTYKSKNSSPPEPISVIEAPLTLEPTSLESLSSEPELTPLEPASVQELPPVPDESALVSPPTLNERMVGTLAEGNWEEAEKLLDELAENPLDLFGFLSQWFDYYLGKGSFPKAFLMLQKVVAVAEKNAYFTECRMLIERYLGENPEQVSAYQLLGENFKSSGNPKEAIGCHSKVISLILEQKSELEAKAYYEKIKLSLPAIEEDKKWKELFEPAPVESAPQEMSSDFEKEETSIIDEPFVIQSEEEKVAAASFDPDGPSEEADIPDQISEATFKGHLTEAEVYLKYGLFSKAIEQLLLVSELCPSREEPHIQLKEIYLKQGMTEKAVQESWILARFYEKRGAQDKKNEVLKELAILDPEGQYKKQEFSEKEGPVKAEEPIASILIGEEPIPIKEISLSESIKEFSAGAAFDENDSVDESEGVNSVLEDLEADVLRESFNEISNRAEVEKDLAEKESLGDLKVKMERVDEYLEQGNKDAAKSLLWKILEQHSNCAEARLKLLNIQETSKSSEVPAESSHRSASFPPAASTVDLASKGLEETSFEGLSEALERSFSDLMSKEVEPSSGSRTGRDDRSLPSDKNEKNEEYVDLTSIFNEELEEEKDLESSLAGLEDTVLEDAFKDFQKGIESSVDEQDYETHYNLGIAYKEMGLLPEAIKEFELAFQGDLRFQDASMMLAACYRERGMTTTAIDFLTNALSDPRCMKENLLAIKYELATIYDSEGDKKRAKALYEEVSRLDPTFRDVMSKNEVREPDLVKPIPSITEIAEKRDELPKRNPEKKKSRISYL